MLDYIIIGLLIVVIILVIIAISKNVNYLINNDIDSNSLKNISAKKLGIPIISEKYFLENLLKKFWHYKKIML